MSFTSALWQSIEPTYQNILDHPFNRELIDGSLDANIFSFYLQQDALYLKGYAKALELLADKAPDTAQADILKTFAREGLQAEKELHAHLFDTFSVTPASLQQPGCLLYTSLLLSVCSLESYPVGLASILPCFWVYQRVGEHIANGTVADNPYQAWIDTYTDDAFRQQVKTIIHITEESSVSASSHTLSLMRQQFIYSTKAEFRFWDTSYKRETW